MHTWQDSYMQWQAMLTLIRQLQAIDELCQLQASKISRPHSDSYKLSCRPGRPWSDSYKLWHVRQTLIRLLKAMVGQADPDRTAASYGKPCRPFSDSTSYGQAMIRQWSDCYKFWQAMHSLIKLLWRAVWPGDLDIYFLVRNLSKHLEYSHYILFYLLHSILLSSLFALWKLRLKSCHTELWYSSWSDLSLG